MSSIGILQTLQYSDHFDYPLTLAELHTRLIRTHLSQTELVRQLAQLRKQKRLEQTGQYYHLPKRSNLVTRRTKLALDSTSLLERAQSLATHLAKLPGILAIYLTGSLAMHNASKDSDIDFMIITHPKRLWTTRLLLTLYTSILGLRRTPQSQHNHGKLCLNLYLTPDSYILPVNKQSLYTAYELIQAVPLYDPHHTRAGLLTANPWVHDFLPNFRSAAKTQPFAKGGANPILDVVEYFLYHLQRFYMRRKITREYITPNSAFFHPHNPSPKVK